MIRIRPAVAPECRGLERRRAPVASVKVSSDHRFCAVVGHAGHLHSGPARPRTGINVDGRQIPPRNAIHGGERVMLRLPSCVLRLSLEWRLATR